MNNLRNLLEHSRLSSPSKDRMEITYANPKQAIMLNAEKVFFSAHKAWIPRNPLDDSEKKWMMLSDTSKTTYRVAQNDSTSIFFCDIEQISIMYTYEYISPH
jgi:hypothetical protein